MKKMVMDEGTLCDVLSFARISLPEGEHKAVLERVNAVLRMCDGMSGLELDGIPSYRAEAGITPARREDAPVVWEGRDKFLEAAPVRDGNFFRVPRIISGDGEEGKERR